jgi:carbon-monoxide dehydrogenase small subunit
VEVRVDGKPYRQAVEARQLLVHFLRDDLGLTASRIGCDTGNCGACTVVWNGRLIKSCMMLACQADGSEIATVAGMELPGGQLHPLQEEFSRHHALQCGYCTAGMLLAARYLLESNPDPSEEEIRRAIKGNICRCTGYVNIVRAIKAAAESSARRLPSVGR